MVDGREMVGFAAFEQAWSKIRARYASLPGELGEALVYATETTGKQVRPGFALLSAAAVDPRIFSQSGDALLRKRAELVVASACAVEMIHTYSLIHDDLPCMDDDDLRRGRPTLHKVFGEATALLAGDALLTDAFSVLAGTETHAETLLAQVSCVRILSAAAGSSGMVLGQSLDMANEAGAASSLSKVESIHRLKTGALIGAACAAGAAAAGATPGGISAFRESGETIGLAFQIMDDLLDSTSGTGKTAGKDAAAGKVTYLSELGLEKGRELVDELTVKAVSLLKTQGFSIGDWETFAKRLCNRQF
jgi:geranylgeranyl pyrophosphate synthase